MFLHVARGLPVVVLLLIPLAGAAANDQTVRIVFAGDISLADQPGEDIAKGKDPFADFSQLLDKADLSIGNLECVVATKGKAVEKNWTFRAHPEVLKTLGKHFHAVSLANNHTGDFGHDAFLEQLGLLKENKIGYFGGGKDNREARLPLILERKGIRIALLGYNDYQPRFFEAGPTWPGVAWAVEEQMVADIENARKAHKADIVIPFLHWGWEEYSKPNRRQKQLARALIDAGADLVVGAHPHIVQGAEIYRDKPIIYSLGNCVFGGFTSRKLRIGWFLSVDFTKSGMENWRTIPLLLDERGTPRVLPTLATPFGKKGDTVVSRGITTGLARD